MTTNKPKDALEASGLPNISEAEKKAAQKEGVKEATKEAAKDSAEYLKDREVPVLGKQWLGKDEIMQYAHIVDLGIEEFKKQIADTDEGIPENKVAGLLELERSGKNRTEYVKALIARLGVKSPYEVTSAGPDYTNDMTPVSKL